MQFLIIGSDTEKKKDFIKHFFQISVPNDIEDKILFLETSNQDQIFVAPWLGTFSGFNKNYIKHANKAIIFDDMDSEWTEENLLERNPGVEILNINRHMSFEDAKDLIQYFFALKDIEPNQNYTEMIMEI